ncbi:MULTISPECIES: hypothetical protein [unclassified Bradyrhizobium]|uniref:hypothetical protein n=1 Tax=unclassified Bradyrhizobium TaxID=2631580 RepID=UPI001BA807BB|nr:MULTISPECIES: hypothetical protein [unclassified Bradyrhizobium]MBR1203310.1 hypothetical protein [Bradyrhizobium sp. AUGA SZCCT0124]MBR1312973.1 hypothetical protein [Bradyrhizobium sp. AUGA SZCCT0051]MBR1341331.1 hypothetical protein [Bradyrhizobium sp. AUGA SZCCT0105]MBR1356731.1 hypothetical protein [Bradyrhizobium sp. AUGA SZCCT0045]
MTNWQKPSKREAPKTKAELREMLTEAVRNTPSPDQASKPRPAKAKKAEAGAADVD